MKKEILTRAWFFFKNYKCKSFSKCLEYSWCEFKTLELAEEVNKLEINAYYPEEKERLKTLNIKLTELMLKLRLLSLNLKYIDKGIKSENNGAAAYYGVGKYNGD